MPTVALQDGAVFAGRYQVVRCIQAGGMGAIYEVIHRQTQKRRALKVMLPEVVENEDLRKRFKLEATVTADIDSEHIVETFDAGIDSDTGSPFLVMELLKGIDLKTHLKKRGNLAPAETLYLLNQVALGLERTHAAGIVHRDLKPENLFLTRRDEGTVRVKILDFGIAKVVATATQTSKTKVMGTPLYMSPEQINGDGRIGPAADLYALAHIAFTLLVGRPYWEEDANEIEGIFGFLLRLMEGIQVPASERASKYGVELPASFDTWFEKAIAPKPADRFASAREQIDALAEALDIDIPSPIDLSGDFTAVFGLEGQRSHSQASADRAPTGGAAAAQDVHREPTQLEVALDTRAISDARIAELAESRGRRARARALALGAAALALIGAAFATVRSGESDSRPETAGEPAAATAALPPEPAPPQNATAGPREADVPKDPNSDPDSDATGEPAAEAPTQASADPAMSAALRAPAPPPRPVVRPPSPPPPPPPPATSTPPPPPPPPPPEVDPLKIR